MIIELVEEYLRRYGQLEEFRRARDGIATEATMKTDDVKTERTKSESTKNESTTQSKTQKPTRKKLNIPLIELKSEEVVVTEKKVKVPMVVKSLL